MAIGLKKFFQRTFWVNYTPPAINESNLNNIEAGITELDNRTVQLDTAKADLSIVNALVKNVNVNEKTGIITITYQNGSAEEIQTNINQIAVNFDFDKATQQMILTLEDGTKKYVDLSAFITNYEFKNSDTITFYVSTNGTLQAFINNGSITPEMLKPNYLADIKVEVGKAETASASAETSDVNAQYEAKLAQSYAVGNSGIREGEAVDNAKYYCQKAQEVSSVSEATDKIAGIVKYDNKTIKKNGSGQLYADASVEVDGSTILKNDENIIRIADALKTLIDNAVQQVQGKGLSSNDFTDALLNKLNGISEGANRTSITNNLLANVAGTALDAVQGKVLKDSLDSVNTELTNQITSLNNNLSKTDKLRFNIIGGRLSDEHNHSQYIEIPVDSYPFMLIILNDRGADNVFKGGIILIDNSQETLSYQDMTANNIVTTASISNNVLTINLSQGSYWQYIAMRYWDMN